MNNGGSAASSLLSVKCKYKIYDKIGSGAYGEVYRGVRDDDGKPVALKRVMITDEEGLNNIPLSTHRELNVLRRLNKLGNDNIVMLYDIVLNRVDGRMCMDLVFELSDWDLEVYLRKTNKGGDMPLAKVINLGQQLMDGVHFMHINRVIHRDLKPANILIDKHGTNLKITDFGLARILGFDASLTPVAVTLWYRSPEILFKNSYLTSCDVWSVGCIIGEMVYGRPLFAAEDELRQMEKIVCRLGYEAIDNWPRDALFDFRGFQDSIDPARSLDRVLKRADSDLRNLIKGLLRFDPQKRMLSTEALTRLDDLRKRCPGYAIQGCTCQDKICKLPDCLFESQNRKLVDSVVRNVLDEDDEDEDVQDTDVSIPGLTDSAPIDEYPHEEVEVQGVYEGTDMESGEDDNEDDNVSYPIITRQPDQVGDSFGSYRSQDNESFSSHTVSSLTGADSPTSEEDIHDPRDLHELQEFHQGFMISDTSDSDTCDPHRGDSRSLDVSESTLTRDGEGTKDTSLSDGSLDRPLSTSSRLHLSPAFLTEVSSLGDSVPGPESPKECLLRQKSLPLHEKNQEENIDQASPTDSKKDPLTRKRIIRSEDSGDSDYDVENSDSVVDQKPTISRHKSIRRRLSIVGPHAASDRKSLCRGTSVLVKSSIKENDELNNTSFGENSLTRALASVMDRKVESPLSGRPRVIVRRRTQWK